jgi:hypothetical protein
VEHFEEAVVGAGNYEQLLSEKVTQWPWFVDMVTANNLMEDFGISYGYGFDGKKTLVGRVICKISKANPTYFNQAKGNPLKNKTFEPAALDIDLASCFEEPTSTIVVHFIQTATLTFVMIGWFCVAPSPSFGSEMEQSNLMETPHRTLTVHFVHLSANSRRQSLGSHFGGGAQISPAHLSTAWKRAVTYTPFTLIEDRFFAGIQSKKRKQSLVSVAAPLPPTAATGRSPGPHEMILKELIKSMQSISRSRTAPVTPADWESWLDLPTLVSNHWDKAIGHTVENLYSALHVTMSGDDPSDFTKQFHICIAFALFLYPYQMWSTFRLYTLSYALLPSKLRSMALEFDATKFNERSIGVSSWIGLVTTIMAERVVLPTILHSLKQLIVNLEAAPTDGDSARFIQRYKDLQSFTKEQYSGAFLDLFGMPPIDTQASATMPSNSSIITRQQGLNCEAFAKYIEVHIAHRSLAAPTPIAKSSNERPLLNECLIPLIAYFPYVILNKPIEDNYGRSKRMQTNFSVTTIAKRTAAAAAAAAATNKGGGDDDDTADVSITPASNLIIDIEDMGVLTAPACLRRVIRIYEDDSVPFVHADRQHLLSSLFAAFAYFTGSTDTGKKWGRVPNPNHRQRIINLTMEWFKVHSPWRYAHIQARKDYGKDIAGYVNLFASKDEGSTFEQACACDPKRDQQLGVTKTSAKTTTRVIGAPSRSSVQCPHLTAKGIKLEYTGEERKQALIACKKDMGYTEETMNLNYAPHPFDVWINQTVRVARRKVTAPNTSRQNNRPM